MPSVPLSRLLLALRDQRQRGEAPSYTELRFATRQASSDRAAAKVRFSTHSIHFGRGHRRRSRARAAAARWLRPAAQTWKAQRATAGHPALDAGGHAPTCRNRRRHRIVEASATTSTSGCTVATGVRSRRLAVVLVRLCAFVGVVAVGRLADRLVALEERAERRGRR